MEGYQISASPLSTKGGNPVRRFNPFADKNYRNVRRGSMSPYVRTVPMQLADHHPTAQQEKNEGAIPQLAREV